VQTIRVGLVGAGNAAKFHLESLLQVHGVQVQMTGVTSLRPESRRAFGQRHGIPAFDEIASMLPHVDVLDIVSPPAAHDGRAFGRGILVDTHRVRRYHRLGVSNRVSAES